MSFPTFTIESKAESAGRGGRRKGRAFSTRLLGYIAADSLWDSGATHEVTRPVWLAYFGTDQETRAFTANLRCGRKASADNQTFQLPKKSPHRWLAQKVPGGVVMTAYLSDLFHLEPALPPEDIRFLFAPPRWWIEAQARELAAEFGQEAPDAARAALFAAFLDRRTHLPLLSDLGFHLRLFRAALETDWLSRPAASRRERTGFHAAGLPACGLDEPLACSVDPEAFAEFLTEQTTRYHKEVLRHGPSRIAGPRRLLPYPVEPPRQLCLDFAVA